MNAYKLNGQAGHHYRKMIWKHLGIPSTDIYKVVKDIENNGVIILHDGRKFKPTLNEIKS